MSRERGRAASTYSGQSYTGQRLHRIAETEYDAAAAFGEPALSDASSDEQMARAISESKRTAYPGGQRRSPAVSRAYSYASSSSSSTLLGSDSGSSRSSVSYAPSFTSSQGYYSPAAVPRNAADETIARDLARSMGAASIQSDIIRSSQYTRPSPAPSPASNYGVDQNVARDLARSWDVASIQSDIISSAQVRSPGASRFPTPTPRYAADETIARNLSREWDVASVQSDIVRNPQYMRSSPAPGPPLVVRSPSPSTLSISSSSGQRMAYQNHSPTPSRPLSPLLLPTRLRTPSIRSMASNSSCALYPQRAPCPLCRASVHISTTSIASLLSSVTRSARHASLEMLPTPSALPSPLSLALFVLHLLRVGALNDPEGKQTRR
ncbi:hypothetical protein B0H12DRAFT_136623 [Mycena haematopus]|nr:hypothetical protein B0H12DRAFT_136623 [Mycena haematopus]